MRPSNIENITCIIRIEVLTILQIAFKICYLQIHFFASIDFQVTKFSMRTWSNEEILRSTNSNSIVMDLLLVGDTYGCDGDSTTNYDRRRSQIILSQKQYKDRLKDSYRSSLQGENMPSIEEGAALVQIHPVYEVHSITT